MQEYEVVVGTRVRVHRSHYWRTNETGTVVELTHSGRFVVMFDMVGIGYDGGSCLMLDINDVDVLVSRD